MAERASYLVPSREVIVEEVIRRSRFITRLAPVDDVERARALLAAERAAHPGATHHCSAWIVGEPGATSKVAYSDDGEPHGTAGRPMLNVLEGRGVGDVAVVVTRYFGGTKLGRGGLVRAYGGGTQAALEQAGVIELVPKQRFTVRLDYGSLASFKHGCPAFEAVIVEEQFTERVELVVEVPLRLVDAFRESLSQRFGLALELRD
jgi:uncharacterized YigZ family protein